VRYRTERPHELTASLPPQPIWLHVDAARLEQIVVNLLTNAAKYTERGGHIWLSVEQKADDCVSRVRDTGIGIAPALLPRVFDLFTQRTDRSSVHKGAWVLGWRSCNGW
jgi:signal transduction histidine kinase